jgi:hypothetical protein
MAGAFCDAHDPKIFGSGLGEDRELLIRVRAQLPKTFAEWADKNGVDIVVVDE